MLFARNGVVEVTIFVWDVACVLCATTNNTRFSQRRIQKSKTETGMMSCDIVACGTLVCDMQQDSSRTFLLCRHRRTSRVLTMPLGRVGAVALQRNG